MGNRGIQISGNGRFNATNVAVGDGARVDVGDPASGLPQARQLAAALLVEVRAAAAAGTITPDVVVMSESLDEELAKSEPEKQRVRVFLDTVKRGVVTLAPLLTAVAALESAIHGLG